MEPTGKTVIHEDVFAEVARNAMTQVNEVFTDTSKKGPVAGLAQIVSERFAPQITVKKNEPEDAEGSAGKVSFELKVELLYGVNIPEVTQRLRETMVKEVESLTGYTVEKIDINVERLIRPEKPEALKA
nr:Asp23/Gls24 family envelope stress response protein [uncultured Anaeromusa sp.]